MTMDGVVSTGKYNLTCKQLISWQTFWNLSCSQVRAWEGDPWASWPISKSAGTLVWSGPWGGPGGISTENPYFQSPRGLGLGAEPRLPPVCVHVGSAEVGSGALGKERQSGLGRLVTGVPLPVTQGAGLAPLSAASRSCGHGEDGSREQSAGAFMSHVQGQGSAICRLLFLFKLRNASNLLGKKMFNIEFEMISLPKFFSRLFNVQTE